MQVRGLQRLALFVGFVLMALVTVFNVHIGRIWILVPFVIYAAITGWNLLRATSALVFSFASKGWDKTQEILKENSDIQRTLREKSHETVENCINKLWN